ncbi:MAG: arginine--tRNA ligase [Zetaproteobacteria bacterium]|nr:arginine--tRNA ligase [Zetaproteobacteria bacterium]
MKTSLEAALQQSVEKLLDTHGLHAEISVQLQRPKLKEHGDYAANVAMNLAGLLKRDPRAIAETLIAQTMWPDSVEKTEIAGAGFINIRLKAAAEADVLKMIVAQSSRYGSVEPLTNAQPICLEFVSANPTGPMHVGHGRGAVVGDVLGRILASQGYSVHREYYINDAGAQIGVLAESVWLRIRELQGEAIDFPEKAYPGEYIVEIAKSLLTEKDYDELCALSEAARFSWISQRAIDANMAMIRGDLAAMNIHFDHFFSEQQLHQSNQVNDLLDNLKQKGQIYRGMLPPPKGKEVEDYQATEQWLFRTTEFGDDVDRPVEKHDGTPTYFAADIAYHFDKFNRGYRKQIDIWGADHGGYITRVQSAMKALTGLEQQPEVLLVQMVNLTRNGEMVRMSKRAGTFVTLREVVDEVGSDAVRFNFMTRRIESQLEFDLEVAKKKSDENPVYYVQYAHARICSILRKAASEQVAMDHIDTIDTSLLISDEEQALITQLLAFPELLARAAEQREAYRLAIYLMQLAQSLHSFYHKHRVICDEPTLTAARLLLITAVKHTLHNGLSLIGVQSPEEM